MDKRKIKTTVISGFFGILICALGLLLCVGLAKSGSSFFYYALAMASPGTAIELLQKPAEEPVAEAPNLSTDPEPEKEVGAQTPEQSSGEEALPKEELPLGADIPENRRGKITEVQYSAKEGGLYVAYGKAVIKNCTKLSNAKIKEKLEIPHRLSLSTGFDEGPQILLYHTHATECFAPNDSGVFDTEYSWRTPDPNKNMVSVGEVLYGVLKQNGLSTVHDTTLHDCPGYTGSYKRSAETVNKRITENPSLTVFLDIHRDAIEPSAKETVKPTAVINGKKAAQIMIIAGCDDGTMGMPDYWENLRFAAALADKLEEMYPGITRPILFDYRRYNMDIAPGVLLIEIGASGNTLEEAQYSAELLGNALTAMFAE